MKTMKFAPNLDQKVDMEKVNLDTVKPWVVNRITNLLGFEDDVVTEFIFNLLENEKVRIVHMSVCTQIELNLSGSVLTAECPFRYSLWPLTRPHSTFILYIVCSEISERNFSEHEMI